MKKLSLIIFSIALWSITCYGQSSAGFIVNRKWGSESIPFFVDSYGNEVTLSTGSGISAGGEYAYDFSWLFNLAIGANFNYGRISRQAKNADGQFMEMGVYLTPSLTLPSRPDPKVKILIGAGPDLYSFGTIKIDAEEAGGENMTIKYKPAIGYHCQILLLLKNPNNGTSLIIGPKYYSVSYTYREKGSTHYFSEKKINNPNGSGIGLYVGIYQKF
jgi:hypothetical protein